MMKKMILVAAFISALNASSQDNVRNIELQQQEYHFNTVSFEVHQLENNLIEVNVWGVENDLSSIAIINQRGKTLIYKYVDSENKKYEFELDNLKPGKYFVKLHMDNEIRMKSIFIR
ncbi:hypothetical protein CW751_09355 [Brumimicrobium salinarum]|uniref:Secretion system C-terminal sorting domain-containing protein n=1 Tax=Brumimicrobium salinarum TaxID=2058658 RepID=A0A2I0R2E9_9FLAO|nr:T9SS type A sorting domain-containing protein [Brumimicrobium salinarum]PKR80570.1 hypothetical protein CW751_09355 [Brumimicrobium salinarum]